MLVTIDQRYEDAGFVCVNNKGRIRRFVYHAKNGMVHVSEGNWGSTTKVEGSAALSKLRELYHDQPFVSP
jgi:hypothetical protein